LVVVGWCATFSRSVARSLFLSPSLSPQHCHLSPQSPPLSSRRRVVITTVIVLSPRVIHHTSTSFCRPLTKYESAGSRPPTHYRTLCPLSSDRCGCSCWARGRGCRCWGRRVFMWLLNSNARMQERLSARSTRENCTARERVSGLLDDRM